MSRIVGLFVENYIGKRCVGHNCDFEYVDEPMVRYHFMIVTDDNKKQILHLERISGECGSGWCTAEWIDTKLECVDKFPCYNYIPKGVIDIDWDYVNEYDLPREYSCDVFCYNTDGRDEYYPSGTMSVNFNLFKELKRSPGKNKRPVWIVFGDSGSGKSFLMNSLNCGITVYETDINSQLPIEIKESVVVVGNKYKFTIDDIEDRLPKNSFIIHVRFNKKQNRTK